MNCLECQKETDNPKFCSQSCAAKHNNRLYPKRVVAPKYCLNCNAKLSYRNKKFCNQQCCGTYRYNEVKGKIKEKTPRRLGRVLLKRYILEAQDYKCCICSIPNEWNGMPIVFVLDHIDGNSENNSITNLRLVCPNCDSQLPTFKSRNRGNGRHYRRIRYANGQSY